MWGARGKRSAGGLLFALGLLLTGCGAEGAAPVPLAGEAGTTESSAPAPVESSATPSVEPSAQPSVEVSSPAPVETSSTPSAPVPKRVAPVPSVVIKNVVVVRPVPFKKKNVKDPELPKGEVVVSTRGVKGSKKVTYAVTYTDGRETGRRIVSQTVTVPPVTQITSIGTKVAEAEPAGDCDPNYSGACVPIASDVDCSSGSGNGPAYVTGPVEVVGSDIYGLDGNNDGIGCENG
ncbi:G5 domain-containing protein [Kribbella sp. CA-294648]|uniref:G5 domain-containing protein n=1 Tax=Kribbella sp. CA-294648 TaxID=3239948 RepID=UPI003D8F27C7